MVRAPDASTPPSGETADARRPEQTRARYPDATGVVDRDGVRIAWERYGDGSPTILLLPTWSIVHSRHWKGQIPYLARHFRVVTFDGRGNGRSDRPAEAGAYAGRQFVADAIAVLDASGTDRAVVAGMSMGAGYALQLAGTHPARVLGLVLIGSTVNLTGPDHGPDPGFDAVRDSDEGWAKYNAAYWRRDWPGFARFFFGQVFNEPHSTKQIEDMVGWALETDPETMVVLEHDPYIDPPAGLGASRDEPGAQAFMRRIDHPALVIHGDQDLISSPETGRRLAADLGARLVLLEGAGHAPHGRDPVKVNLVIREFVRSLGTDVR
jgi:pimeloyl-ACP methyl ester carboxylesterase